MAKFCAQPEGTGQILRAAVLLVVHLHEQISLLAALLRTKSASVAATFEAGAGPTYPTQIGVQYPAYFFANFGDLCMAVQRTFSIIKPDAVAKNQIGAIQSRFEQAGLNIVAAKMLQLSEQVAAGFYAEHKERGFFKDLVAFMTSGPVLVQVLEGENAIAKNRELMGATNPKEAAAGTIRADFAQSIDENAVHGSDSESSAAREIAYFFSTTELCPRLR